MAANDQHETSGTNEEDEKQGTDGLRLGVHCTKDNRVKVSVIPPTLPKTLKRLPAILCCVVDVSGSMQSEAVIKDAMGKTESHGLTILDLVKHSIKTIIHCLSDDDYLSIVSYSSKAEVVTELIKMDKTGKDKTLKALEKLTPSGQTNLWDGLYNGLEVLRKSKNIQCSMNNAGVLLFTDGLPNIIPPKGHIGMLEKYMDTNQELVGIINTYGFGYSLDTKLLNDLAIKGNGNYSFIPDSSFVGTIFVNSISNFCCTMAKNTILKVETDNNRYDVQVGGGYEHLKTSWGVQINLGNIMYGQNKDVVLKFEPKQADNNDNNTMEMEEEEGKEGQNENMFDVTVDSISYVSLRQKQLINKAVAVIDDDNDNGDKLTDMAYYRLLTCDTLRECMQMMKMNDMDDAQKKLKELIKLIQSNKALQKEKFIEGLLEDLSGQSFEAISKKQFYDKWGKHYLPSLTFAHLHQYNNNFKDPGVQFYGGNLFKDLRDKANDIFIKLPPPKPSKPQTTYNTYGGWKQSANKTAVKAKPVDMRNYYNASGGCFHGQCHVLMMDDTLKMVQDLCLNDVVKGGAVIQCVVKHKCKGNKIGLSNINGLLITPYHPIKLVNEEWVFPIDVDDGNIQSYHCDFVYNFVLSKGHIMNVNGVECCTLGHNFNTNQVIQHEYFGTNKVVDDLKKFDGWKNGMVVLNQHSFKRNEDNHLVQGIVQ